MSRATPQGDGTADSTAGSDRSENPRESENSFRVNILILFIGLSPELLLHCFDRVVDLCNHLFSRGKKMDM